MGQMKVQCVKAFRILAQMPSARISDRLCVPRGSWTISDFCGCDSSSSPTGVLLPSVPSALLLACFWAAHTQPVRSRALEIPGGLTVGIHCVSLDCVENVAQSIVGAY